MERELAEIVSDLGVPIGIRPESIELMDFQGEMSRVFSGTSEIYGQVVIKTAYTEAGLSQTAIDEIKRNMGGYSCIPKQFQPEILAVNDKNTILIMKHAGFPIRDLLWLNRDDQYLCKVSLDEFGQNLIDLYALTRNTTAFGECQTYTEKIVSRGNSFLTASFIPEELRLGFGRITKLVIDKIEGIGAFANMDATQGNLLVDPSQRPQTLKLIDPKLPRITKGIQNFIGIPEIDLGMFLVTVELNSPPILQNLYLENILMTVGKTVHDDQEKVKLYLDMGRVFGCILVSCFPNSSERVQKYIKQFGLIFDNEWQKKVEAERETHIQKALNVLSKY